MRKNINVLTLIRNYLIVVAQGNYFDNAYPYIAVRIIILQSNVCSISWHFLDLRA